MQIASLCHRVTTGRATHSIDQSARFRVLVQWPDRAFDFGVRDFSVIAPERPARFDIDDLLGDRTVGRHEVIGRLHDHDLLLRRIDAEIGEEFEAGRLSALGDQHDVDAAYAHGGTVAHRNLRRTEALPGIALQADDLDLGIDRLAGAGRDLAAHPEADLRAETRIEADAHGDRVP